MKIIIETDTDKVTNLEFQDADDGQATFENLTAILFCIMENLAKQVKETIDDEKEQLALCDYVSGACDQLCSRAFPELWDNEDFSLSDAALIYAEDQIIKRAEKKGITFEEAMAEYEKKARDYIKKNSGVLQS